VHKKILRFFYVAPFDDRLKFYAIKKAWFFDCSFHGMFFHKIILRFFYVAPFDNRLKLIRKKSAVFFRLLRGMFFHKIILRLFYVASFDDRLKFYAIKKAWFFDCPLRGILFAPFDLRLKLFRGGSSFIFV